MEEDSLFIVLSGEPINEPIVSHGPFVMNTVEEIYEAFEDYRNNKFGTENF
jgi:quercetin 2,3-dioxygenase